MTSTAALALHYGLRLDAAPEFVQGYVDGMRLDQRGQGVACGRGWIPRSKKCSPDKAKQTSKEAKAKTLERSKARAELKKQVKASKGQKAYVKPEVSQAQLKKVRKPRTPKPLTNEKILSQVTEKAKKMKGKSQEISIPLQTRSGEKELNAVGKAEVFGDFAIHRHIHVDENRNATFDPSISGYKITHIPTGLSVASGETKRNVKAAMYMLQAVGAGDKFKPTEDVSPRFGLSAREIAAQTALNVMANPQFRDSMQGIADVARDGRTSRDLSTILPRKLPDL